ncbi:patched domain-containing protein 3-like [Centruroides sculpturatus]|uniref:patched domain-containing protein 3-like n=1 Tax=Centruroides sculpturatus TaxID=218467 RepID=UPI000C6D4201|nr:patched domain-containing protein 3-like [Centruroides sculpturatus]
MENKTGNMDRKIMILRNTLARLFGKLGEFIALHPLSFIILPVVVSLLLSVGFININFRDDINYLFSSDKGRVFSDKSFIDKTFPMNTSQFFDILRMTERPEMTAVVYITSTEENNMLKKEILMEIEQFDKLAKNISIIVNGKLIQYQEICGIVNNKCFENPILSMVNHINEVISRKIKFKYPVQIDKLSATYKVMSLNTGGVKTDNDGNIQEMAAVRLLYPTDESDITKKELIAQWRKTFYSRINKFKFNYIKIFPCPVTSVELEIPVLAGNITPLIGVSVTVITILCVLMYMTNDWVKSKPWMGIAAVVSAGLATVSSFGLLSAAGVDNPSTNVAIPFIILATEIDDAFVMIACWRITDSKKVVAKRMKDTYSNAAVSITITSLTNVASYCIAMTAPFPIVRLFCSYAATCVGFTYLYQITFFGGCLALSGYREEKGLHPFTFRTSDLYKEPNSKEHDFYFMKVFSNKISAFISRSSTKILIILLYFINLSIGILGIFSLREGLNFLHIYPKGSLIYESYRLHYQYFTEYSFPIHIVINETLDYSDWRVQKSIEKVLSKFQSHPNIAGGDLALSWLRYYKVFQNHPVSRYSLMGYDVSRKQDFIDGLRYVFFKIGNARELSNDVAFNKNFTEIICSRFFMVAKDVTSNEIEYKLIKNIWNMADESEFRLVAHTVISPIIEQGIVIRSLTFQLFWQTALVILIVFFLFIPDFVCAIIVALSIVSAIAETVGYMAFWKINLDIVSVIILILCIGFCVNYPTHMCYSFLTCDKNGKEKLKRSLYHVGFPIFQGSLSTVIGILVLLYNNMYGYVAFVKIVTIISVETAFHSMFVIPVLLVVISSYLEKRKEFSTVSKHNDMMETESLNL